MTLGTPIAAPALGLATTVQTQLDSVADMIAWSFEARTTTPIAKLVFRTGTLTGSPGTASIVLSADANCQPTISGGLPVDIGGGSPTLVTHTTWASATNYTVTFTNAFTPTLGTRYWIVMYASSGTWDASNRIQINRHNNNFGGGGAHHSGLSTDGAGASWSLSRHVKAYYSLLDASNNPLDSDSAGLSTTVATATYSVSSNPDEYGILFTIPANCTAYLHGFWWLHRINDAVNSDHTLFIYTDPLGTPVLLDSFAVDVSVFSPFTGVSDVPYWRADDGPFTLTGGTVVACSVRATGTGTLQYFRDVYTSQAVKESALLFRDYTLVTREGGTGAFTQVLTDVVNIVVPHFELLGTAGGGGLAHIIGG